MIRNRRAVVGIVPALIVAASSVFATGCVDKEKCDEAIRVTRDALTKEQTDLARQWREYAWKTCDDSAMTATLDQEIVSKEAEIAKKAADELKKIQDAAQQRLKAAGNIWSKFSKLDVKKQTDDNLKRYRDKAEEMAEGLPDEYVKQIGEYNEKLYDKMKDRVEELEKKKKK
jgi:hypothetical protein